MKLQEQLTRIKEVMGLIVEQSQKWKLCNKCIGNYSGSLSKCAFYAIERFEENYGSGTGNSMGDDYFETKYTDFDKRISERLNKHIPKAWNNMDDQTKMQIWNFMFNSDSKPQDKFRWLAVLYLTADDKIQTFDEPLTMKIINKEGSEFWKRAIDKVNNTTSWNYHKLIQMINGQYGTYDDKDALAKTWSYRAEALNDMYDDCINGIDPDNSNTNQNNKTINNPNKISDNQKQNNNKSTGIKKTITATTLEDFRDKIRSQTLGKKIDTKNVTIDMDNFKLTYYEGDSFQPVVRLTIAYSQPGSLNCEACNSVIQNNKVNILSKGTFESEGYQRTYNLFAILPDK